MTSAHPQESHAAAGPQAIVDFWRRSQPHWFSKSQSFDRDFSTRFMPQHMAAARRELDDWNRDAIGALALLILLDQFPRNAFRGTAHMYATDPLARRFARQGLDRGHMDQVEPALRLFFTLPFSHSEDLADQEIAVRLSADFDPVAHRHAVEHRDIVQRFGRFPHRNPLLLRESTQAELDFLTDGGFAG